MDLACRSGERLTGESDRWAWPGPTVSSFSVRVSAVCPHLTTTNHFQAPIPATPPKAARRVPGAAQAQSLALRLRPGRRGVRARGALSTGEHSLGLPQPQPGPLRLCVPPSSAPVPPGGNVPSQLCEAQSGSRLLLPHRPPFCVAFYSFTVSLSTEARLAELPG